MKNFQNKEKIIRVSKFLSLILRVGLVLWAIGAASFFFLALVPIILKHANMPNNSNRLDSLLFFRNSTEFLFCFVVNLNLLRFVNQLKDGRFFTSQMAQNLELAGKWWLILWFFTMATQIVFHQTLPDLKISIDDILDLSDLFAGLFVVFIAWLLREAQELQEEQELTV